MKKKIAILTLGLLLGITGVVSAASLWGTYKGYDVIRLTVNGSPVKATDAPAISFNNRTMIPIYMLKDAGVQYSWDSKNKTVDIKQGYDAEWLRFYSKVTHEYNLFVDLGLTTNQYFDGIGSIMDSILLKTDVQKAINQAETYRSVVKNDFTGIYKTYSDVSELMESNGFDSDMEEIINTYSKAIVELDNAKEAIKNYYTTGDSEYADSYFDYMDKYIDLNQEALNKSNVGYNKFYNLISKQ